MTYQIVETEYGPIIRRNNQDGSVSSIPMDEGNSDYVTYLAWVAEGNTPEPWPPAE